MAAAQLRLDSISDVLISDLLAAQRLPSNLRVPLGALKTGIRTAFVKARKEKVMTFRKKMERGFTLIDLHRCLCYPSGGAAPLVRFSLGATEGFISHRLRFFPCGGSLVAATTAFWSPDFMASRTRDYRKTAILRTSADI